ncbi:SMC-Scp complex subunit ScpB [Curtobacterium luteum]|uniref:SMC-Scp complex subunit ScpB n=1 Tax=Curtobacterium luteum TaxID=33881 RepID=UPI000AAFD384|nr:SMC-Scp complex subunit ScpB [Curtobacterium luteum]
MTDDAHGHAHGHDRGHDRDSSSAEPGGADELADARAIEQEIHDAHDRAARPELPIDRQLEAILMIADEPQSLVALGAAVGAPVPAVRQAVERLVADFDGVHGTVRRGFELREVGGGWRFYVRQELDDVVEQFVEQERPSRLSQAALETLAVVAYKQPITRSQIASIRAVNVDGVVRTLVARGLVEESFTDAETGAVNYVTSDLLLQQLGINSLDELPLISPLLDDGADGFGQNEGIPDGRA